MGYCGSVPSVGVWNGYRVMVNTEDHPPAHVHVIKDDKAILIRLDGCKAAHRLGTHCRMQSGVGKMARLRDQSPDEARYRLAIELGDAESAQDASAASYDAGLNALVLDLNTGTRVVIPIDNIRSLKGARPEQLREVEILGGGDTLNWEALNVSLTTSKLVREAVGHTEQNRKAGSVSTPKKAAAGRANGKLGGRPKKVPHAK